QGIGAAGSCSDCALTTNPPNPWGWRACLFEMTKFGAVLAAVAVFAIFTVIADMLDRYDMLVFGGIEYDDALSRAAGDPDAFDWAADQLALVGDQHDLVGLLDRE